METVFALEFIGSKMRDMGYQKDEYLIFFRHLVLRPSEIRTIEAFNQYYFLIEPNDTISITSDMGLYDLFDETLNEQIYEHQGMIKLTNLTAQTNQVKFIQVLPKNK